jgi:hypothetical protein
MPTSPATTAAGPSGCSWPTSCAGSRRGSQPRRSKPLPGQTVFVVLLSLVLQVGLDTNPARSGVVPDSTRSGPGTAQRPPAPIPVREVSDDIIDDPDYLWDNPIDVDRNHNCVPDYVEARSCMAFARRSVHTRPAGLKSSPKPKVYAYPPQGVCSERLLVVISPCPDSTGVSITLNRALGDSQEPLEIERFCPNTIVARALDFDDAPASYVLTITVRGRQYSRMVTLGDNTH